MAPRSPVLGYNHNVRYGGRMWHVQTEDSGVQNPHIFTHLFYDGTILASKKVDYDPTSEVSIVQKLMQAQHKALLRDLKSGKFDEKIVQRYGPIERDAAAEADEPAAPAEAPPAPASAKKTSEDERPTVRDLAPMLTPPPARPPTEPEPRVQPPEPPRRPSLTPARPAIAVNARSSSPAIPAVVAPAPTLGGNRPRAAPPTIGSGRSGAAQTNRPTAEGVIVARPSVIVGGEGGKARETQDFWKTEPRRPTPDPQFGGDLISEKSLDEVILAYLSEDAPKK